MAQSTGHDCEKCLGEGILRELCPGVATKANDWNGCMGGRLVVGGKTLGSHRVCNGTGWMSRLCAHCNGSGRLAANAPIVAQSQRPGLQKPQADAELQLAQSPLAEYVCMQTYTTSRGKTLMSIKRSIVENGRWRLVENSSYRVPPQKLKPSGVIVCALLMVITVTGALSIVLCLLGPTASTSKAPGLQPVSVESADSVAAESPGQRTQRILQQFAKPSR